MKRFTTFLVVLLMGLSAISALAQYRPASEKDLLISNYVVDFGQIFLGKVIRGENMLKSFGTALYSAAPSALLHHQAMKMAGRNWKNTFTAQLVAQKGNQIVRRSILGRPFISTEIFTENEFDYLFLNVRLRGLRPELRLNAISLVGGTLGLALRDVLSEKETYRLNLRRSLLTGVQTYDSKPNDRSEGVMFGVSITTSDDGAITHEVGHYFQFQRHNALWDAMLYQDFSQEVSPKWLRLEAGHMTSLASLLFLGGEHDERWLEWEAESYARLGKK